MIKLIQKQSVEVERHPLTKKKIKVTLLDEEGRPHCDDGPAIFTYNPIGFELSKTYCEHGIITRDCGPAIELIDLENFYHKLVWMKDGKKDRDDEPAEICTDMLSGVEFAVSYWKNNEMHREQGAALITRDRETGKITAKLPILNGIRQPVSKYSKLDL